MELFAHDLVHPRPSARNQGFRTAEMLLFVPLNNEREIRSKFL